MDKMRQMVALTVLGAIVLVAAGWFLLLSPKRTEAADLRAQADQQVTANGALRTQISILKAQAKALPAKQAKLAAVAAKIPEKDDLVPLVYALQNAANAADVELVSISPAPPTDLAGAAPGAVVTVPAAGTSGVGATSPAGTLKKIDLALNVVGGYFQVVQFLDQLESLSRAMKVSNFTLAPGTNPVKPAAPGSTSAQPPDRTLNAAISATVFMAPGRTTVAVPTAPAVGK